MRDAIHPSVRSWGVWLFVFFFSLYGVTGSKLQFGYLGQNIDQAEALVSGEWGRDAAGRIVPFAKTGALEVAAYVPFAAVKLGLERAGIFPGLQQIVYVFVEPLTSALLCVAFFGLALRLYRRAATAATMTLILGTATMIWPYAKIGMEPMLTLWTVVGMWALVAYAQDGRASHAGWLGASVAAVMLTKVSGPLHGAVLGFAALWMAIAGKWWERRGFARDVVICGGWVIAGIMILLLSNKWRYGGWLLEGRYSAESELRPIALWEAAAGFLFGMNKSVFIFSPPLLIAMWHWRAFVRRFTFFVPLLIGLLLLTLFQLSARTWIEEVWGTRRMHYLIPVLALPLGIWWERRGELVWWVRRACTALIALGVLVQCVGVLVDYTAMTYVLGFKPHFSQEHYLWDPQYNHIRFNWHLLASARERARTGESRIYVIRQHYIPANYSGALQTEQAFPVDGYDRIDLWPIQQRQDWAGRPYWFRSLSFWLAAGLLVAACVALVKLLAMNRRYEDMTEATAIEKGPPEGSP